MQVYLVLVLISTVFGVVFLPAAWKRSKPLASPYQKADLKKRVLAAVIDVTVCLSFCLVLVGIHPVLSLTLSPLYLMVKEGVVPGRSVGKIVAGLLVVELKTGAPCTMRHSVYRNFLFVLPGLNVAAAILEWQAVRRDEQGMRLGDRIAHTQVVDGGPAVDLTTEFQERLMKLFAENARRIGARARLSRCDPAERRLPRNRPSVDPCC